MSNHHPSSAGRKLENGMGIFGRVEDPWGGMVSRGGDSGTVGRRDSPENGRWEVVCDG